MVVIKRNQSFPSLWNGSISISQNLRVESESAHDGDPNSVPQQPKWEDISIPLPLHCLFFQYSCMIFGISLVPSWLHALQLWYAAETWEPDHRSEKWYTLVDLWYKYIFRKSGTIWKTVKQKLRGFYDDRRNSMVKIMMPWSKLVTWHPRVLCFRKLASLQVWA